MYTIFTLWPFTCQLFYFFTSTPLLFNSSTLVLLLFTLLPFDPFTFNDLLFYALTLSLFRPFTRYPSRLVLFLLFYFYYSTPLLFYSALLPFTLSLCYYFNILLVSPFTLLLLLFRSFTLYSCTRDTLTLLFYACVLSSTLFYSLLPYSSVLFFTLFYSLLLCLLFYSFTLLLFYSFTFFSL
jgi:hypothetical protein